MKIRLLFVGRPRDPELNAVHDRYADRLRRLRVEYSEAFVREAGEGSRFSEAHVRERETRALLESGKIVGRTIALDRRGRSRDSEGFAAALERWASPAATFVIGGPLGLDPGILDRFDDVLSLSPMTLPHELARVLLTEQLYRAMTILRGFPYHK